MQSRAGTKSEPVRYQLLPPPPDHALMIPSRRRISPPQPCMITKKTVVPYKGIRPQRISPLNCCPKRVHINCQQSHQHNPQPHMGDSVTERNSHHYPLAVQQKENHNRVHLFPHKSLKVRTAQQPLQVHKKKQPAHSAIPNTLHSSRAIKSF